MRKRYQVFVSSTYTDLIEERKEVSQAILKCDCFPAGMELFPASNKKQWTIIKQVIDDSDFYLVIIAGRYGSLGIDDSGKKTSYTEMEFDYALSTGKPIIVMLHRNPESLPAKLVEKNKNNLQRLDKFREKASNGRMVSFWENKDQLHSAVLNSLHKAMADTPEAIGWIRADVNKDSLNKVESSDRDLRNWKDISLDDFFSYLYKIGYNEKNDLFKEQDFLKEFVKLISVNQSSKIIRKAISLIPSRYNLEEKTISFLKKEIDYDSIFKTLCLNINDDNVALTISVIEMFNKLNIYSYEYAKTIFNLLIDKYNYPSLKVSCLEFFEKHCYFLNGNGFYNELISYVLKEISNNNRKISIDDLIHLLTSTCTDEEEFELIYKVFFENDLSIRKSIVKGILEHCGSEIYITDPKIQRKFFKIFDEVISWNDDKMTAEFLRYCLFTRTFDIYTVDEIYETASQLNDDVFYIFIRGVSYEEFGSGFEEVYEVDKLERERIIDIIKKRNHPRKNKLIELFS